jgi:predicted DCC family thiol-disulfide oxidoreductase YuxK
MKIYYDTKCDFCKANIKPYTKNKNMFFNKAKSTQTIVVEHKGKTYVKSDAIIELLKTKSSYYKILYICPKLIRDLAYDIIAINRHRFNKNTKYKNHKEK